MQSRVLLSAFVVAQGAVVAIAQTTTTLAPTTALPTRPRFKPTDGIDNDGAGPMPIATQAASKTINIGVAFAIGISVFILFVVLALLRAVYVHRKEQAAGATPDYSKLEDTK